jgi:ferredoxin
MKAIVDANLCVGCGLCVEICPAVFTMNGALAVVIGESVPPQAEAECREAKDQCPVCAISVLD